MSHLHWTMPVTLDKRALEKIKMRAMKNEVKKWIEFDHSNRWNFGILDKIRSIMYGQI